MRIQYNLLTRINSSKIVYFFKAALIVKFTSNERIHMKNSAYVTLNVSERLKVYGKKKLEEANSDVKFDIKTIEVNIISYDGETLYGQKPLPDTFIEVSGKGIPKRASNARDYTFEERFQSLESLLKQIFV